MARNRKNMQAACVQPSPLNLARLKQLAIMVLLSVLPTCIPAVQCDLIETGQWQILPKSQVVAIHMIRVPGTEYWLLMERNTYKQSPTYYRQFVAGLYHERTYEYHEVKVSDMVFCSGYTFTEDGDIVIVGGHNYTLANPRFLSGLQGIRIFRTDQVRGDLSNLAIDTVSLYGLMRRWYPTATQLPDGRIFVMGGTKTNNGGKGQSNAYNEILDPQNLAAPPVVQGPMLRSYMNAVGPIYYPFNFVLPTGDLMSFVGRLGRVIDPATGLFRAQVAPDMPGWGDVQYPLTGTCIMLPLKTEDRYKVEFVFIGGQNRAAFANKTSQHSVAGSDEIRHITVDYNETTSSYTFSNYEFKTPMHQPRVMPDAVLLPNGCIIIINGVEIGVAGDGWTAHYPVFTPELYCPHTNTLTQLAPSNIARMYHSTAGLTMDGNLLVGGNDRSDRTTVHPWDQYSKCPTAPAEYRMELFRTPFFFRESEKPVFVDSGNITLEYNSPFQVHYTSLPPLVNVTSAVLYSPTAVTHSFNMHQRMVVLEILESDGRGILTIATPWDINVAPPGLYMLFLLNGEVYSRAIWVTLRRPAAMLE